MRNIIHDKIYLFKDLTEVICIYMVDSFKQFFTLYITICVFNKIISSGFHKNRIWRWLLHEQLICVALGPSWTEKLCHICHNGNWFLNGDWTEDAHGNVSCLKNLLVSWHKPHTLTNFALPFWQKTSLKEIYRTTNNLNYANHF